LFTPPGHPEKKEVMFIPKISQITAKTCSIKKFLCYIHITLDKNNLTHNYRLLPKLTFQSHAYTSSSYIHNNVTDTTRPVRIIKIQMLYVKLFSWKQFYTQHWHLTWLLVPSYVHTIIKVTYITMQHAHHDRAGL
jgi:hypothetical protein